MKPEPEPILEGTDTTVPSTVLTGPTTSTDEPQHDDICPHGDVIGGEDHELQPEHEHPEPVLTHVPVLTPVRTPVLTRSRTQPPVQREPSTRIRRAPERYNLATTSDLTTTENYLQTHMSVSRGLRMFKEKTSLAIEGEVESLLAKKTFSGVDVSAWAADKKKKILRLIVNIDEILAVGDSISSGRYWSLSCARPSTHRRALTLSTLLSPFSSNVR